MPELYVCGNVGESERVGVGSGEMERREAVLQSFCFAADTSLNGGSVIAASSWNVFF